MPNGSDRECRFLVERSISGENRRTIVRRPIVVHHAHYVIDTQIK